MECKACELLIKGEGGLDQDDHYGGCIPNWVETEDVWAILTEPLSVEEITEDIEGIDIDTDYSDSDISDT
tara:strand:+ start:84 stop:293 length:210 start_codon:yes stop_codon:yes gene_type:complete